MTSLRNIEYWTLYAVLFNPLNFAAGVFAAAGPEPGPKSATYQVLDPIESGSVTLYPIVRIHPEEGAAHWQYLTLDQGLKSGEVVITEAGKAAGLVRSRRGGQWLADAAPAYSGDEVNTLVLLNNSNRPLLLLAGEIVTGGKQDRVIAKDRIVPAHSLPLDLSVFCIEPHRWVESSPKFGVAGNGKYSSFMVEPSVRREAMAAQDQSEVWNAVGRSIAAAPAPSGAIPGVEYSRGLSEGTSSYARAMATPQVQKKIDAVTAPALGQEYGMPENLRKAQVVGVAAAIDGHILWADMFASTDLLDAYWGKLVRSYAAESLHPQGHTGPVASKEAALRFVTDSISGQETSEGSTAVYRYREIHGQWESVFVLESLLPNTGFEVHRTRLMQSEETKPVE